MGRYTNDSNGLELDYEQINDHIAADKVEAAEGAFYPTSFRAADELSLIHISIVSVSEADMMPNSVTMLIINNTILDKMIPVTVASVNFKKSFIILIAVSYTHLYWIIRVCT